MNKLYKSIQTSPVTTHICLAFVRLFFSLVGKTKKCAGLTMKVNVRK